MDWNHTAETPADHAWGYCQVCGEEITRPHAPGVKQYADASWVCAECVDEHEAALERITDPRQHALWSAEQ